MLQMVSPLALATVLANSALASQPGPPGDCEVRTFRDSVRCDLVALADLAKATTVSGRLLGIEFTLTPQQVRAVAGFAATMK